METTPLYSRDKLYNEIGVQRKKSLFLEMSYDNREHVIFTLKEHDHDGYESLYKLYMSHTTTDPSEYVFALTVFGSWSCWQNLSSSPVLSPFLPKWRNEVQVRNRSLALIKIAEEAPTNFHAAKYLLEQEMLLEDGKNSYQEKKRTKTLKSSAKKEALQDAAKLIDDDAARVLNLHKD